VGTQELRELSRVALGIGIDSLRTGRPFVAFALWELGEDISLEEFIDVDVAAGCRRARHRVASVGAIRYAVVGHEELRDREGIKRLAVVAEVGETGSETAMRMAQPYRPFVGPRGPLEISGSAITIGDAPNALAQPAVEVGSPPSFVALCPACARKNRVSLARVRTTWPKCGGCGAALAS
jgi:hypothetical protein